MRSLLPALPRGGCPISEQNTPFDSTGYPARAQNETTRLAGMAADKSIGSHRIAVLVPRTLSKLQTRRIGPGYGVFDNGAEAVAWLFAPDA